MKIQEFLVFFAIVGSINFLVLLKPIVKGVFEYRKTWYTYKLIQAPASASTSNEEGTTLTEAEANRIRVARDSFTGEFTLFCMSISLALSVIVLFASNMDESLNFGVGGYMALVLILFLLRGNVLHLKSNFNDRYSPEHVAFIVFLLKLGERGSSYIRIVKKIRRYEFQEAFETGKNKSTVYEMTAKEHFYDTLKPLAQNINYMARSSILRPRLASVLLENEDHFATFVQLQRIFSDKVYYDSMFTSTAHKFRKDYMMRLETLNDELNHIMGSLVETEMTSLEDLTKLKNVHLSELK